MEREPFNTVHIRAPDITSSTLLRFYQPGDLPAVRVTDFDLVVEKSILDVSLSASPRFSDGLLATPARRSDCTTSTSGEFVTPGQGGSMKLAYRPTPRCR